MSSPNPAPAAARVVVAGHLCLDILPDLTNLPPGQFLQLFQPGRLVEMGAAHFAVGGAVANTGLALVRLGIATCLVAKIGADPFADIVDGIFQGYAGAWRDADGRMLLRSALIAAPQAATSYTLIISPPGVDRIFLHCTGANDSFVAADVDFDALGAADLFHFGYPPLLRRFSRQGGRELVELLRRARAAGMTTSLDLSLPDAASEAGQVDWAALLAAALPEVDIFLPSIEEILFMLRRHTYDLLQESAGGAARLVTPELLHNLSSQILEMGVRVVGFKLGERGIYLRTAAGKALAGMGRARPADPSAWGDQTLWAPAFQVGVVGTTGAGDSAIAGFLAGLLRGLGPRQALGAAAAVGACNVEAADAQSGLRSWDDTLARVAAGWPRRSLYLSPAEWSWDEAGGVWVYQG